LETEEKKEQQGKTRDPLCCSPFATLHLPHLLKCLHNNRLPYTEACVTPIAFLTKIPVPAFHHMHHLHNQSKSKHQIHQKQQVCNPYDGFPEFNRLPQSDNASDGLYTSACFSPHAPSSQPVKIQASNTPKATPIRWFPGIQSPAPVR
jgi:hypothetical protein